jgi:glycerophosphoryl diester phosphodiesterase
MNEPVRAESFAFFDHPGPIPFAHRGGAFYPPNLGVENSLAAFQVAIDLGYRYLETDVHGTADGHLLAFHDRTLDRVTDRQGRIARMTLAEVSRARIGGREPIPTLAELLTTWPDARINVDVKQASAIRPLLAVIDELRVHDRVCVASFSQARINQVRRALGRRVATAFGPVGVVGLRFLPLPQLRERLLASQAPCVQVPSRIGRLAVVTPQFMRRAHALGKHVHVWTVDDAAEITRLLDLGVDGIMTDRIDTLRRVMLDRGQWH